MNIFAKNDQIIFECEYCNERIHPGAFVSKRAFITKLNKFYRVHDNCKWKFEREQKRAEIIGITDHIIEKLKKNCV